MHWPSGGITDSQRMSTASDTGHCTIGLLIQMNVLTILPPLFVWISINKNILCFFSHSFVHNVSRLMWQREISEINVQHIAHILKHFRHSLCFSWTLSRLSVIIVQFPRCLQPPLHIKAHLPFCRISTRAPVVVHRELLLLRRRLYWMLRRRSFLRSNFRSSARRNLLPTNPGRSSADTAMNAAVAEGIDERDFNCST